MIKHNVMRLKKYLFTIHIFQQTFNIKKVYTHSFVNIIFLRLVSKFVVKLKKLGKQMGFQKYTVNTECVMRRIF